MICKLNEDAVENGGDHKRGSPPNTQCYHLKRLEMYERGRGWRQERGREIFQLISEKEKKSKISGAQVCFFFKKILQKLCF